eukprot:767536-Hanusia_phi.AAC.2
MCCRFFLLLKFDNHFHDARNVSAMPSCAAISMAFAFTRAAETSMFLLWQSWIQSNNLSSITGNEGFEARNVLALVESGTFCTRFLMTSFCLIVRMIATCETPYSRAMARWLFPDVFCIFSMISILSTSFSRRFRFSFSFAGLDICPSGRFSSPYPPLLLHKFSSLVFVASPLPVLSLSSPCPLPSPPLLALSPSPLVVCVSASALFRPLSAF